MASGQTEFYQLNQWQAEDQVLRTEFNQDNAKVDAALHALAQTASGLSQSIAGLNQSITALNQAVAAAGTCSFVSGSYTGDGTQSTTLTFEKKPYVLLVYNSSTMGLYFRGADKGARLYSASTVNMHNVAWGDHTVTRSGDNNAILNLNGAVYNYLALVAPV